MTMTERMAMEWLMKKYKPEDIKYNYNKSPDFELSDGRRIEVKRPTFGTLFFPKKQWESLDDHVEVLIMEGDRPEPIAIVPFSKIKRLKLAGKPLELMGRKYRIIVSTERKLDIRCSEETFYAFRRYAADYRSYEEALKSLLVKAGFMKDAVVF
jgi:hypothetical protein